MDLGQGNGGKQGGMEDERERDLQEQVSSTSGWDTVRKK